MKKLLSIIVAAIGLSVGAAYAAEATPDTPASGPKLTKQQRADARAKRRADMAAANKKGELAKPGEAAQDRAPAPKKVDKTERAAKRAEVAKENKAGKLPATNEGATGETKK